MSDSPWTPHPLLPEPAGEEQHTTKAAQLETLELIHAEVQGRRDGQREAATRVETKATLVMGLCVTVAQVMISRSKQGKLTGGAYLLIGLALVTGLAAVLPRRVQEPPKVEVLTSVEYVNKTKAELLNSLIGTKGEAFVKNTKAHERKANLLVVSLALLALGTSLSVLATTTGNGH